MSHPVLYGFARGFTRLEREALNAVRRHHYDHPQPEGAHVTSKLIAAIENDAAAIGGDVATAYRTAMEHRLSPAQMAGHLAMVLAQLDASQGVQAILEAALGPEGDAAAAAIIRGAAGVLGKLDQPTLEHVAPPPAPDPQPEPAPDPAPTA